MPGPIKFKLGVCVSHDESMNPIVFGAIQCLLGSTLSKKGDFVNFSRKHDKSRLPGPIKFELGVCVPHDENRILVHVRLQS